MVIGGDAGDALADSCYEMTVLFAVPLNHWGDAEENKTPESTAK